MDMRFEISIKRHHCMYNKYMQKNVVHWPRIEFQLSRKRAQVILNVTLQLLTSYRSTDFLVEIRFQCAIICNFLQIWHVAVPLMSQPDLAIVFSSKAAHTQGHQNVFERWKLARFPWQIGAKASLLNAHTRHGPSIPAAEPSLFSKRRENVAPPPWSFGGCSCNTLRLTGRWLFFMSPL